MRPSAHAVTGPPATGEPNLQAGRHEHDANADHQDRCGRPERFAVEAYGEAKGRDEQADRREGERDASGEGDGAAPRLARRRAKHDGHERQDAGRKDREQARQQRKPKRSG